MKTMVKYYDSWGKPVEKVESPTTANIDWEQRRYEIAKAAMQGILSNEQEVEYSIKEAHYKDDELHTIPKALSQFAIACADALIKELEK